MILTEAAAPGGTGKCFLLEVDMATSGQTFYTSLLLLDMGTFTLSLPTKRDIDKDSGGLLRTDTPSVHHALPMSLRGRGWRPFPMPYGP